MNYIFHILTMINIYLILSLSLNILVGYTGLLSLCHAAFYGIGAYISAILMTKLGISFFIALPIAIIGTIILSLLVSTPSVRLKGDFFILTTLAFQIIAFYILYNWIALTQGPYGIKGIPPPYIFGHSISGPVNYFFFSLIIALLCLGFVTIVLKAPFGQVLKAIREDEVFAQSLGKNVNKFKIQAFIIASGLAAVAGALFAHYVNYIDPTSFTFDEAVFLLSIIIIGGVGNVKGPILGVILVLIIQEILRFLGISDTVAPNIRQIIYGLLLILFMHFRPQGIAGEYKFE